MKLGAAPHPSLRDTFSPQVAGRRGVRIISDTLNNPQSIALAMTISGLHPTGFGI